jgi:signal transduction histidine kinase/DNA-binding response OmpR family regulator
MYTPPLVLIADDEPDTLSLLEKICVRAGFQTMTAADGEEAYHFTVDKLPDLVLLDVQMPHMTGFQVVEALRQREDTRLIPIIIITAAATTPSDIQHGLEIGADDYIPKPFNFHELTARMRAKLRAKELEERLQQRTRDLETLVKLGIELSHPPKLEPLARKLLQTLAQEIGVSIVTLHILETPDNPGISLVAHKGEIIEAPSQNHFETYIRELEDESVRILNYTESAPLFLRDDIHSGILVPLIQLDVFSGLLAVGHYDPEFFDEHHLRVMNAVSRQVSMAILNGQLFDSLRAYAEELESRVEERTEALRSAQENLMRSEKLASLGRLSAEIAHEINNPLQPIMTSLEGALEDAEADIPIDPEDLRLALNEASRLKRIVARLLDFARPDSGGIVATDLQKVIEEVLALTYKKLERTHIKVIEKIDSAPPISANPDQLKQVFLNLTINAIDAMNGNPKGLLQVSLWKDGGYVCLSVLDNGKGIPPEQITRIFDPFFSTKEGGSGLGLAISHSIIEAHGGKIEVKSELNKGTEFVIRLPIR